MPRIRTTKLLAKRIDLQYFTKKQGFRRWRFLLSIALPVVAAVWLLGAKVVGDQKVYTSGPLSTSHAVFGNQCSVCHVRGADFRAHVPDSACLKCHDAPIHNARQTVTPECSSCHIEHQGKMRLAATATSGCVQCHGDLHTTDGQVNVVAKIGGWDKNHPQFAALRPGAKDPGTIKLNHAIHLQKALAGPKGPVQMVCDDCHRFNGRANWPYSVETVDQATQKSVAVSATDNQQQKRRVVETGASAYGLPIKYVNQCAGCHALQFDKLIDAPAPHDKPEIVRAFIRQKLTEYISAHPEATAVSVDSQLPTGEIEPRRTFLLPTEAPVPTPGATRLSPQQWVDQRAQTAERLLWSKNCRVCHAQLEGEEGVLPTKVTAIIPTRWMPRAEFDHQSHRMMTCTACHTTIPQSRQTSDVNLADIQICRDCHAEGGLKAGSAEGRCFECHTYHDWRKEKGTKGSFDVRTLRGSGPAAPSASTEATY